MAAFVCARCGQEVNAAGQDATCPHCGEPLPSAPSVTSGTPVPGAIRANESPATPAVPVPATGVEARGPAPSGTLAVGPNGAKEPARVADPVAAAAGLLSAADH